MRSVCALYSSMSSLRASKRAVLLDGLRLLALLRELLLELRDGLPRLRVLLLELLLELGDGGVRPLGLRRQQTLQAFADLVGARPVEILRDQVSDHLERLPGRSARTRSSAPRLLLSAS